MKKIFGFLIWISAVIPAIISCSDAKYGIIENAVYIDEAAPDDKFNQQTEVMIIDDTDVSQTITVRLAQAIEQDITIHLGIDETMLEDYNERMSAFYEVLPEQYRSIETNLTIPKGEFYAETVLTIRPFPKVGGKSYAVPICIESVSGSRVSIVGDARHIMFLLAVPVVQQTPVMSQDNSNSGGTFSTPIQDLNELTLEFWMQMDNIYGGNAFYSNVRGSSPISTGDFYIRWWKKNDKGDGPWFQNQMTGFFMDDISHPWEAGKWFHIAYTFNGQDFTLYINGEKDVSSNLSGRTFSFGRMVFASDFTYGQTTSLAQIRLWSKCLSQSSIRENMSRSVPVNSKGLVGYLKMDVGEGRIFKDSSKNGNDLPISGTMRWSNPVNFSKPNIISESTEETD